MVLRKSETLQLDGFQGCKCLQDIASVCKHNHWPRLCHPSHILRPFFQFARVKGVSFEAEAVDTAFTGVVDRSV